MKTIYSCFLLIMLFSGPLMAQPFPATEKETTAVLNATPWQAKYMMIGDRRLDALQSNVRIDVVFTKEGHWEMNFFNEKNKGLYKIHQEVESISLENEKEQLRFMIISLSPTELWLVPESEEEDQPVFILAPIKKA